MAEVILSQDRSNKVYRIAVSGLFFMQGLCFASWASRIPSIQEQLRLSDTLLGIVLFALPVGSMLALPFSGWLVTRFGSKKVAINALLVYSLLLILLGLVQNITHLVGTLVLFGIMGNLSNIAINTQAVGVEAKYGRNIMASFHGLWSLAGFTAAGIGAITIGNHISTFTHFLFIVCLIFLGVLISFPNLLPAESRGTGSKSGWAKPDSALLKLGIIAFCCMICEGAMFDWSGVYFQKVVRAEKEWVGAGYVAFMSTMAAGRFVADKIVNKIGFIRMVQLSGVLITSGLGITVAFPFLSTSIFGFLLVGIGVSSVIPLVYSEAGKSKSLSAGVALTVVSSIGFLGFLVGPPLIGVISGIFTLRTSFMLIAFMGIAIIMTTSLFKRAEIKNRVPKAI